MRFVPIKREDQQERLCMNGVRQGLVVATSVTALGR